MGSAMVETAHVAMVQTPGMGHLIPLVEFAKSLIQIDQDIKFSVTVIIPNSGPLSTAEKRFLEGLPDGISYTALPPIKVDDLANVGLETRIALTVSRSIPDIRDAVKSLVATKKVVAMVVDLFGTDAFEIAEELNISQYLFYPSNATNLSVFIHMPELDKKVPCEYKDMHEPVLLPGCIPLQGKDLLQPLQDRKNDAYKWTLHHASRYRLAKGIMVNSFEELETGPIKALNDLGTPPVYPVGPLTQMACDKDDNFSSAKSDCLRWLDNQPIGSVLFVSFGSGGTLTHEQFLQVANGLELSEQRFIWVVRTPSKLASAAYFNQIGEDPFDFLPPGYLERIKGRGLLLPNWAPQAQILNHASTGGFLTHCGWNSVLESVVCGIPLIAWPLYAEQRTNAVMLSEDLKVALRAKESDNGLIECVEIARVVKILMEGEEGKQLRSRMKDFKDKAHRALSKDGSSTKSLLALASEWKSKICT